MISFWDSKYTNLRVKGFVGLEGIYDLQKLVERWPRLQRSIYRCGIWIGRQVGVGIAGEASDEKQCAVARNPVGSG